MYFERYFACSWAISTPSERLTSRSSRTSVSRVVDCWIDLSVESIESGWIPDGRINRLVILQKNKILFDRMYSLDFTWPSNKVLVDQLPEKMFRDYNYNSRMNEDLIQRQFFLSKTNNKSRQIPWNRCISLAAYSRISIESVKRYDSMICLRFVSNWLNIVGIRSKSSISLWINEKNWVNTYLCHRLILWIVSLRH